MNIKDFVGKTEEQANGVWVRYAATDVEFLIAYVGTDRSRRFRAHQMAKHRRKIKGGVMPPEVMQQITLELILKHILKGWRGLTYTDEAGEHEFEYNAANARRFLEQSTVAQDFIADEASNGENFGIITTAEDEETEDDKLAGGEEGGEEQTSPVKSGAGVEA